MRLFLRHIAVSAVLAASFLSCSQPKEPAIQQENIIESDYLLILEKLTSIMRADTTPEETLNTLRNYVDSDKSKVADAVHSLRKSVLAMDENERAAWRKSAIPRLNSALEQFAHAQLQLQKKLNDAQKWELGEILSLLKQ